MAERPDSGWFVERGIGEDRAARLEQGEIVEARIAWPGALAAGQVEDAKLIARAAGSARGTARFANGEEALVDKLPRDAAEGATLRLAVSRAAIGEAGRIKRAQARPTMEPPRPAPTLLDRLRDEGHQPIVDRGFPISDWFALLGDAFTGIVAFTGGALAFSPTPAMTLIDIDGTLPARQLALAAIPAIARSLRRFDLAGSIGIDFPTLPDKADRQAVDTALRDALEGWAHEHTAMNGFGFVQLVSRLERPSLLHRIQADRAGVSARALLRRAEGVQEPGPQLLLTAHPAVLARIAPAWLAALERRTGRTIRCENNPALALEAGFAQALAS